MMYTLSAAELERAVLDSDCEWIDAALRHYREHHQALPHIEAFRVVHKRSKGVLPLHHHRVVNNCSQQCELLGLAVWSCARCYARPALAPQLERALAILGTLARQVSRCLGRMRAWFWNMLAEAGGFVLRRREGLPLLTQRAKADFACLCAEHILSAEAAPVCNDRFLVALFVDRMSRKGREDAELLERVARQFAPRFALHRVRSLLAGALLRGGSNVHLWLPALIEAQAAHVGGAALHDALCPHNSPGGETLLHIAAQYEPLCIEALLPFSEVSARTLRGRTARGLLHQRMLDPMVVCSNLYGRARRDQVLELEALLAQEERRIGPVARAATVLSALRADDGSCGFARLSRELVLKIMGIVLRLDAARLRVPAALYCSNDYNNNYHDDCSIAAAD